MSTTKPDIKPGSALITGAGKRIGLAIARDLAAHGWAVALHYSASAGGAEDLAARIVADSGKAVALGADFTDHGSVDRLVARAADAIGPLTLLVNNAAIFERDEIDNVTAESWQRHIDVNLRAPVFLAQAFAAQRPAGVPANIVNILDQRVLNPTPFFMSYTVSKMGLHALTHTWALALAPDIRVNAIGPGFTLPSPNQTDAQFQESLAVQPLKRGTTPEEICDAVRFILNAPALTGQTIALDGGQHLAWAHPKGGWPKEG
jgi:NAD(P)-dependent dehydrogenase (short-subunit alcohol dehydrogenase family)